MKRKKENLIIKDLISGGLIVTYRCTASCAHCLYKCSPKRDKRYITPQSAKNIVAKIAKMSCHSIHIGGGEPFINFDQLRVICAVAAEQGINIEYIETNASWAGIDDDKIIYMLIELQKVGVNTLLISISPFHNEFVPWAKTEKLISLCKKTNMQVFPWIADFICEIRKLNENSTHALSEYEEIFGSNYSINLLTEYYVRLGGRAIETYKDRLVQYSIDEILEMYPHPCLELASTTHFHMDCYENYIPGLCTGLAIEIADLEKELPEEKYPIINVLYQNGIKGLYEFAKKYFNFSTEAKFVNKCHLCNEIRKYIFQKAQLLELKPQEYYALL